VESTSGAWERALNEFGNRPMYVCASMLVMSIMWRVLCSYYVEDHEFLCPRGYLALWTLGIRERPRRSGPPPLCLRTVAQRSAQERGRHGLGRFLPTRSLVFSVGSDVERFIFCKMVYFQEPSATISSPLVYDFATTRIVTHHTQMRP